MKVALETTSKNYYGTIFFLQMWELLWDRWSIIFFKILFVRHLKRYAFNEIHIYLINERLYFTIDTLHT